MANSRPDRECASFRYTLPSDSKTYRVIQEALAQDGVGEAFRHMCMLLGAPGTLTAWFLVLRNLEYILRVIPSSWEFGEIFSGWNEVAIWALAHAAKLEELAGSELAENRPKKIRLGVTYEVHPLRGHGLKAFSIFSAICCTHELKEYREPYALLQAQLLIARWRELEKQQSKNSANYIELYEAHGGPGDFAKNVRSPYAASLAVRELSTAEYTELVDFMHPERHPEVFAGALCVEQMPLGWSFSPRLRAIRHYCGLQTSSHKGGPRNAGEYRRVSSWVDGFVAYNQSRFGIEVGDVDLDDETLDSGNQELIRERSIDIDAALSQDVDPDETAAGEAAVLTSDLSETGSDPASMANSRSRVHYLEIDRSIMPWSAIHLRPREIEGTLLASLIEICDEATAKKADQQRVEDAALVATCLETGRTLPQVLGLCAAAIPEADLTFLPAANGVRSSRWCWKAIEPLYQQMRPAVPAMEVSRASYLLYPAHSVAGQLIRSVVRYPLDPRQPVFLDSVQKYEQRIKQWLRGLDLTGRLTLAKIAHLKWSLLAQLTGGDFASASLVLGLPHPMARTQLFYSLISVERAVELFREATCALWSEKTSGTEDPYLEELLA